MSRSEERQWCPHAVERVLDWHAKRLDRHHGMAEKPDGDDVDADVRHPAASLVPPAEKAPQMSAD